MDLRWFLANLTPRYHGELVVNSSIGVVGLDPEKLLYEGLPPKLVRITVEGGPCRTKETGDYPTVDSGDLRTTGDEFIVPGPGAISFLVIAGNNPSTLRYTVYF